MVPLLLLTVVVLLAAGQERRATPTLPTPFDLRNYSGEAWLLCQDSAPVPYAQGCGQGQRLAAAIVNNSFLDAGWDFVQVTVERHVVKSNESRAYYAAGFLEGYLTAVRILEVSAAFNTTANVTPADQLAWVSEHLEFMRHRANSEGAADPFWRQVGNLLVQIQGMADGYTARAQSLGIVAFSFLDLFLLNFFPELSDVADALGPQATTSLSKRRREYREHCSGFVKVTSDDLFVGHATWSSYSFMVRQYKVYDFGGTVVSFSSAAGTISSGDDWYLTSLGIASIETTNGYYGKALNAFITPQSVSEFLRALVANFIATSAPEWVNLFQRHNSGTYNNQWMAVDLKLYRRGTPLLELPEGLLWVAEQIPGNVTSADETEVLRSTSYWASFNTPFFRNIYVVSGFLEKEQEWGSLFSYTAYARPEIFKRNAPGVVDMHSMEAMMRFNDWQVDPFSIIPNCSYCNPSGSPLLSVASRGDLVSNSSVLPKNEKYAEFFEGSAFGAIDAKIASATMLHNGLQGRVVCGPTTDNQPPFRWSAYQPGGAPPGSPDLYNFSWAFFNHVAGL